MTTKFLNKTDQRGAHGHHKRILRSGITVVALGFASLAMFSTPALADFDDALNAYSDKQYENAVDLWNRYAVAGDVKSKQVLGDIYSGKALEADTPLVLPAKTGVIPQDDVEALAWYILAANHDFKSYNQSPTYREINAKYKAQERVPVLQQRMSTSDVKKAQKRVVEILSAQSEFDLYRLGKMYQGGQGLQKDNVKALMFYELAKGRNRNSNAQASDAAKFLISIMSSSHVEDAQEDAANWEPPLPEALKTQTPRQLKLEEELRELRSLQTANALDNIEKEFADNEDLLQSSLAALGFYQGPIDGSIGAETRVAIRSFQYSLVAKDSKLTKEEKRDVTTGKLTSEQKVKLIKLAAKRDHPQSQYVYGLMHARGIGVSTNGKTAIKWLKASSDYGYALAHFALGEFYRSGIRGEDPVQASLSEATYHYGQAFALGHKPAQAELLKLRYEGPPATNERGSME